MHSNKSSTRQLCLAGLLTAVVMVLTMIRLPMTEGYAHIGDAAILLCGLVLGPLGAVPAALGSALIFMALQFTRRSPW